MCSSRSPAVIVEPVSYVGKLLDLAESKPAANRVDRAGGNEKRVTRLDFNPVEKLQNLRFSGNRGEFALA